MLHNYSYGCIISMNEFISVLSIIRKLNSLYPYVFVLNFMHKNLIFQTIFLVIFLEVKLIGWRKYTYIFNMKRVILEKMYIIDAFYTNKVLISYYPIK